MSQILDGRVAARTLKLKLKEEISQCNRQLQMVVIQTVSDDANQSYLLARKKICSDLGVMLHVHTFSKVPSTEELLTLVDQFNRDDMVDGIMIDRPLPKPIDERMIDEAIDPSKDIDGSNPYHAGLLLQGRDGALVPSTAKAIEELLHFYKIPLQGKRILMIGRSKVVGAPTSQLMIKNQATVTVAHSKTLELNKRCLEADIVIAAIGKAQFLDATYFGTHSIVVDVGIHSLPDGSLCGDVASDVYPLVSAYTPVPGGVGPLTNIALIQNLLTAYHKRGG